MFLSPRLKLNSPLSLLNTVEGHYNLGIPRLDGNVQCCSDSLGTDFFGRETNVMDLFLVEKVRPSGLSVSPLRQPSLQLSPRSTIHFPSIQSPIISFSYPLV